MFSEMDDHRPINLLLAIESRLATIPEYTHLQKTLLEAQAELTCLALSLTQEREISAGFLRERDEGVSAMHRETTRLAAELATERAVEQLERLVRWRRAKFGVDQWYLLELKTVLLRVGEYLEQNPYGL